MVRAAIAAISLFAVLVLISGCAQQQGAIGGSSATDGSNTANGSPAAGDSCAGVTCNGYCSGTTLYKEGRCVSGECAYTVEYDSPECAETPDAAGVYTLDVNMRSCTYDVSDGAFYLFFTIMNLGQNAVPEAGSVWVSGADITNKACAQLQRSYGYNQILWGDLSWQGSYPWQGQQWVLRNFSSQRAIDYKLVYCPNISCLTAKVGDCTENNGEVWYEGSTAGCIAE